MFPNTSIRHLATALGALALLAMAASGIAAQDATPAPPIATDRSIAYPVSIHRGSCEAPVAQPIGPTVDTAVAGYDDDAELIGTAMRPPVMVAEADVIATLAELTDTPHVIAVHASAEAYGQIVACGEIAGYEDDGRLIFGLRATEGSTVSGIAILDDTSGVLGRALEAIDQQDLLGDGQLRMTVFVVAGDISENAGG